MLRNGAAAFVSGVRTICGGEGSGLNGVHLWTKIRIKVMLQAVLHADYGLGVFIQISIAPDVVDSNPCKRTGSRWSCWRSSTE